MKCNDEITPEAAQELMATMAARIEFPMFLKIVRLTAGMGRLELAAKAKMSMRYLGKLESGRTRPSPQALANLIDALPMTPEQEGKFLELAARKQIESAMTPKVKAVPHSAEAGLSPMTPEEAAALSEIMRKGRSPNASLDENGPCTDLAARSASKRVFICYPGLPQAVVDFEPDESSRGR